MNGFGKPAVSRPELPIFFALVLFGPSLLTLVFGAWFLMARQTTAVAWADTPAAPGAILNYAKPEDAPPSALTRAVLLVACISPAALLAFSVLALAEARLSLGHWPRPMLDNVTLLAQASFMCTMFWMLLQCVVVPATIALAYGVRRHRQIGIALLLCGAGNLANFAFAWFSPLGPWVIGD